MKSKKAEKKPEQLKLFTETAQPKVKQELTQSNFYIVPLKKAIRELVLLERHMKHAEPFKQTSALYSKLESMKKQLLKDSVTYRHANEILESIREVNKKVK